MNEETRPICHVVAGPNGSGKSTFALRYLPEYAGAVEYVNPDLMAQGMSPAALPLRISHRVLAGGHDVPTVDVMRRYARSSANVREYAALADSTLVFYAVPAIQRLIYRRNGDSLVLDPALAEPMRKELGI